MNSLMMRAHLPEIMLPFREAYLINKDMQRVSEKVSGVSSVITQNAEILKFIDDNEQQTIVTYYSPKKVQSFKAKSVDGNTVKLSCSKNTANTGYIIQQKVDGKWKTVKNIKISTKNTRLQCSVTIPNLNSGEKYSYRIRAYKTVNGKKIC